MGELSVEVVHNESDDNEGLDDDAVIDIEAENTDYALRGKAEFALGADSDSAHGEDVDLAENEGYTVIGETEESEHDSVLVFATLMHFLSSTRQHQAPSSN